MIFKHKAILPANRGVTQGFPEEDDQSMCLVSVSSALYVGIFQRHEHNVLASGQEILAENQIVSLVLTSQRNVTYANIIL